MSEWKFSSKSVLLILLLFATGFLSFDPIGLRAQHGVLGVQDSIAQAFNSSIPEKGENYRMTLGPGNSVYTVASNSSLELLEQERNELILHKWDYQANLIWTRDWAPNTVIRPNAIAADTSGIIITGLGFDQEVWVGKWSCDGDLLWYMTWQESYWQEGVAIDTLSDGSILVGCLVRGPLIADNTFNHSIVLLKYTSSGNLLWNKTVEWFLDENPFVRGMSSFQIYACSESRGYFSTPHSLFEVVDEDISPSIWSWNTSTHYARFDFSPDGIFYTMGGYNVFGRTANSSIKFNITSELVPWEYLPGFWGIRGWKNKTVFVLQSFQSNEEYHLLLQKYNHHDTQLWNKTLQCGDASADANRVQDFLFSESGCAYILIYGPRSGALFLDLLVYEIEGPCEGYLDANDLSPLIAGIAILAVASVAAVILFRKYTLNTTK